MPGPCHEILFIWGLGFGIWKESQVVLMCYQGEESLCQIILPLLQPNAETKGIFWKESLECKHSEQWAGMREFVPEVHKRTVYCKSEVTSCSSVTMTTWIQQILVCKEKIYGRRFVNCAYCSLPLVTCLDILIWVSKQPKVWWVK